MFLFLLNFPSNNKTASRTHTQQHRLGMSHLALPNLFLLLPKWAVAENLVGQTIILKSSKRPKKMGHITYSAYYIRKYAHVCLYVMRPGWKQNLIEIWSEVAAAAAHKWGFCTETGPFHFLFLRCMLFLHFLLSDFHFWQLLFILLCFWFLALHDINPPHPSCFLSCQLRIQWIIPMALM